MAEHQHGHCPSAEHSSAVVGRLSAASSDSSSETEPRSSQLASSDLAIPPLRSHVLGPIHLGLLVDRALYPSLALPGRVAGVARRLNGRR